MSEFRDCEILESLLDRAREITLLSQCTGEGSSGEGLDLGLAFVLLGMMRDEARQERVEIISGRGDAETWKEVNGSGLPKMFKTFRTVFSVELNKRFNLDSTPDKHTLLALKMHPAINTDPEGPQLKGKSAKAELMEAEYNRALRRHAKHLLAQQRVDLMSTTTTTESVQGGAQENDATSDRGNDCVTRLPAAKRRKGLLDAMAAAQSTLVENASSDEESMDSVLRVMKSSITNEVDAFDFISKKIVAVVRQTLTSWPACVTVPLVCLWFTH